MTASPPPETNAISSNRILWHKEKVRELYCSVVMSYYLPYNTSPSFVLSYTYCMYDLSLICFRSFMSRYLFVTQTNQVIFLHHITTHVHPHMFYFIIFLACLPCPVLWDSLSYNHTYLGCNCACKISFLYPYLPILRCSHCWFLLSFVLTILYHLQ